MSQQSFAAAMTDLEEIVRKLQQGDVPGNRPLRIGVRTERKY